MDLSPQTESDLLERHNLVVSAIKQLASRLDQLEALVRDERSFLDELQALGGPWLLHDRRLAALEVATEHLQADRGAIRAFLDTLNEPFAESGPVLSVNPYPPNPSVIGHCP